MIKAIIFDWGGVLIEYTNKKFIRYVSNCLKVDEKRLTPVLNKYLNGFASNKLNEEEFWNNICSDLKIQKSLKSLWYDAFSTIYKPIPGMFELASNLHNFGYKVGIISDTELPCVKYFHKQKYRMFDAATFSCVEGQLKKEKLHEISLKRLGIRANEGIFIDNKSDQVEYAQKIGLNAILFKNLKQLKKELADLGVKVE